MNMKLKRCQKIFQSEVIGWGSMGFGVYTQSKKKKSFFKTKKKKVKNGKLVNFKRSL